MSDGSRSAPRFLPTLTEVVDPSLLTQGVRPALSELDRLSVKIQQQMLPLFEQRLQQAMQALVQDRLPRECEEIRARLHIEMTASIRQAVQEQLGLAGARPDDPAAHGLVDHGGVGDSVSTLGRLA